MEPTKTEEFLTVSALNALVTQALAERFGLIWLRAEIGNCTRAASGHFYLTLKDSASSVRAVMFRSRAALCDFEPREGDAVLVQARPGLYEARGDFQLNIQILRRDGLGTLFEQFQKLRAQLQAEGLFDEANKRPIAPFVRAIGVITSLAGAALHDVLTTLSRRAPHVPVIVYPASVQGAQAPLQLRQALAAANERQEVDVLLLVRGGGSLEDLWAFNNEALARDIAASALPIICGVGHESDVSIADFAADLRAATPTAAAELSCMSRREAFDLVANRSQRLQQSMQRYLERLSQRLDQLSHGLVSPSQRLAQQAQTFLRLQQRLQKMRPDLNAMGTQVQFQVSNLQHAWNTGLQQRASRLALAQARLHALAPQTVLERGYALVRSDAGEVVRDTEQLQSGQTVHVQVAHGNFAAQVLRTKKNAETPD